METIFSGNIVILYMITGLSIFNLTAMNRDQQVALIYGMSFLLVLLQVLSGRIVMFFLITVLYLALEWFTEDKKKLQIITAPYSKVLDFLFLSVIECHLIEVCISLFLASSQAQRLAASIFPWMKVWTLPWIGISLFPAQWVAIAVFFLAIHKMLTRKFRSTSITSKCLEKCSLLRFVERN